jgi:hypothetical protein
MGCGIQFSLLDPNEILLGSGVQFFDSEVCEGRVRKAGTLRQVADLDSNLTPKFEPAADLYTVQIELPEMM